MTQWFQVKFILPPMRRGFHLISADIRRRVPELRLIKMGTAHIFIMHTSASLALSENADPTVRADMEAHFNEMVPEDQPYYAHTQEGSDDMPAHIKSVLLGSSLMLPITNGDFNLGTWQGIYLCEHRDRASGRQIVITMHGLVDV